MFVTMKNHLYPYFHKYKIVNSGRFELSAFVSLYETPEEVGRDLFRQYLPQQHDWLNETMPDRWFLVTSARDMPSADTDLVYTSLTSWLTFADDDDEFAYHLRWRGVPMDADR